MSAAMATSTLFPSILLASRRQQATKAHLNHTFDRKDTKNKLSEQIFLQKTLLLQVWPPVCSPTDRALDEHGSTILGSAENHGDRFEESRGQVFEVKSIHGFIQKPVPAILFLS